MYSLFRFNLHFVYTHCYYVIIILKVSESDNLQSTYTGNHYRCQTLIKLPTLAEHSFSNTTDNP